MAKVYLDDTTLTGIANQTRRLKDSSSTYTPSQISEALSTVETGITPTGTINITTNGTHDVTQYASANVNTKWTVPEGVKLGLTTTIPSNIDTSHLTNMYQMFYSATITDVSTIDTSSATNMEYMFQNCYNLLSVSNIDTSKATSVQNMFRACSKLTTVPIMNFSSMNNGGLNYMFYSCTALNNTSLDNILQSCITVNNNYTAKKLTNLSFNATNYPASRIQALPHYQDFVNAGWSIGY